MGRRTETDGRGATASADGRRRPAIWGRPGSALIAASVVLPIVLFVLSAWYSYNETMRRAEQRVERTTRILEEHALKVFESQRLVIEEVNLRLRFMDWSREADRADLAVHAATHHVGEHVEAAHVLGGLERDRELRVEGLAAADVVLDGAGVDLDRAIAGDQAHAGDGGLAAAGAPILGDFLGHRSGAPYFFEDRS